MDVYILDYLMSDVLNSTWRRLADNVVQDDTLAGHANTQSAEDIGQWDFRDPLQKAPCCCSK